MGAQATARRGRRRRDTPGGASGARGVRRPQRVAEREPGAAPDDPAGDQQRPSERLENPWTVVPVLAQELAATRREAAALRRENMRLLERIRDLQRHRRLRAR